MLIITNNPLVKEKYPESQFLEGSYIDVLIRVRDFIHKGYQLLMHPLPGSIKPNETPFKTLLLYKSKEGNLDLFSLQLIENAIETTKKFLEFKRKIPQKILKDYQIVDLEFLESALKSL